MSKTPFRDEDPEYLEQVLENFVRAKLDIDMYEDLDLEEVFTDYSQPQSEEEFVDYIQAFQDLEEGIHE